MKLEIVRKNNRKIAVVNSDELLITDALSALDLVMTVKYETGCTDIAVNKEAVTEDFFILSTCLAGEILQKFINYGVRFAIYGDFSCMRATRGRTFIFSRIWSLRLTSSADKAGVLAACIRIFCACSGNRTISQCCGGRCFCGGK